jgi:hypothetical protein
MSEITIDLVREIERLKIEMARLTSLRPQYNVLNHAPVQNITGTENNFALGNYDVVWLNPTANRTINGITNGFRGRQLYIVNVASNASGFTLTFNHQNAGATTTNRISTPTDAAIALQPRKMALLNYTEDTGITSIGAGRWFMMYPPS